jgi:hypothetical protein
MEELAHRQQIEAAVAAGDVVGVSHLRLPGMEAAGAAVEVRWASRVMRGSRLC